MTGFLLDTNIISELGKPEPQEMVVEFLSNLPIAWLSTITLHELEYGLALLPESNRRHAIERTISGLVNHYSEYIIPVEQAEAQEAAHMRVLLKQQGKTLHLADLLIAGTAKAHNLTLATRNIKDFKGLHLDIVNPFI